ncbi:MAG: GAF domain-containing protein [Anaerolineales bacterium]|nr:GAF domain-containing protein [Anaerolineales bacterium]
MTGPLAPAASPVVHALAGLREIARALSAAWDVDTTLDLIARKTTQVMRVDSCSIYLLDPAGETLWLRASTGLAKKALGLGALKMGQGLTGWAAQHGVPVAVRDAQADPRFHYVPWTEEEAFQSLLAVPLINRERIIGAMNVQTRDSRDFAPEAVELAALISDLAAGALDRALLYDHMDRQIAELSTLARVSETVNSPLYLDEMLNLVVEMAAKVMGTPVCTLRLLDEEQDELVVRAAQSSLAGYAPKPPLKRGEGINGLVVQERRPITAADVRTDPRFPFRAAAEREGLVSMLAVPLIVRERVIGVLNCFTTEPHTFTEKEIALFSTLANQTALAIENSQLVTNAAVVREMHHRVRNNLQTVAMLLRLQAGQSGLHPRDAASAVQIAVNRIQSIAAVHEVLAQQGYRLVDVKEVAERLARLTGQSLLRPDLAVAIHVEGDTVVLPSRPATSLALVINELLQNALEHAFVGRTQGEVAILFGHSPDAHVIEVADDGVGLPDDLPASLGLEIIEALVRDDLHGQIEFLRRPAPETGTLVVVRIPPAAFTPAD